MMSFLPGPSSKYQQVVTVLLGASAAAAAAANPAGGRCGCSHKLCLHFSLVFGVQWHRFSGAAIKPVKFPRNKNSERASKRPSKSPACLKTVDSSHWVRRNQPSERLLEQVVFRKRPKVGPISNQSLTSTPA